MKYMLLIYNNASAMPQYTPEEFKAVQASWWAYQNEATEAGILITSSGLEPVTSATTVRVREGKTLVTDGPFAETHEQLAGYFLVDCKDLDEAIVWAAKIPGSVYGSIEIRPLVTYSQDQ